MWPTRASGARQQAAQPGFEASRTLQHLRGCEVAAHAAATRAMDDALRPAQARLDAAQRDLSAVEIPLRQAADAVSSGSAALAHIEARIASLNAAASAMLGQPLSKESTAS